MLPPPVPISVPKPILRELELGESVLWVGQPNAEWMKKKEKPVALMSIPLTPVVLAWIWGTSAEMRASIASGQMHDLSSLVLPAFGLLGLGGLVALAYLPWNQEYKARHTFYALTDRRALIVSGDYHKQVKSVLVSDFALERHDFDLVGDVILCRERIVDGGEEGVVKVSFANIDGAREVERLARELQQRARAFTESGDQEASDQQV